MRVKTLAATIATASAALLAFAATPVTVHAAEATQAAAGGQAMASAIHTGLVAIAIGFSIAIAAGLGTLGQGRAAASAMEAIGRNPDSSNSLFVPFIIGLAFIESLVLYTLVIAFLLLAKM